MEKFSDKAALEIHLRNKEIRILVAGHFDFIHAGHSHLIQEAKSKFKKVYLILGIIEDDPSTSLLGNHEKIETFKGMPEIDEICLLSSFPTAEDLRKMNVDYLATADCKNFDDPNKLILIEKKINLSTDELIARIIRDYDTHVDNLLQVGYHHTSLKISRATEVNYTCKRKLKQIKKDLWRGGFCVNRLEYSVDSARKQLRNCLTDWNEGNEVILTNWLRRLKGSTSILFRLLKDIWEAA